MLRRSDVERERERESVCVCGATWWMPDQDAIIFPRVDEVPAGWRVSMRAGRDQTPASILSLRASTP